VARRNATCRGRIHNPRPWRGALDHRARPSSCSGPRPRPGAASIPYAWRPGRETSWASC
jgi:hypothetical protein